MESETKNDLRVGERHLHDDEKRTAAEAPTLATSNKVSIYILVENTYND